MPQRRADHPDDDDSVGGAGADGPTEPVLTLVCLTCGWEYFLSEDGVRGGVHCEKCGSTVFREFLTPAGDDDAARDFEESTARDLDPDDPEGDTLPGDVIDLNRV